MKKCLLILILVAYVQSFYSQPVPPVRVEDCPDITFLDKPTMDGIDDENWWSVDQTLTIFNLSNENDWTGEADYDITFKMASGWTHFYTYLKIIDDVEHSWNGTDGDPRDFDNVEWYFQLDTQTVPDEYTDNTVQIRFNRGDTGFQTSTFREGITEEDFQWYTENAEDGWILECAIPWTNVIPNGSWPEDVHDWLESGCLIGFDLLGADSDGTDPLVGDRANGTQMAWDEDGEPGDVADDTKDNAQHNTSVFGYLNMFLNEYSYVPFYGQDVMGNIAFPNPASDFLNISEPFNYSQVKIYSLVGTLLLNNVITDSQIDISFLKPGLYIAVFDDTDTFRFIKG